MKEINDKCWVVPVVKCSTNDRMWEEAPNGCCECGMLEYLCFDTKEESVIAYENLNKK